MEPMTGTGTRLTVSVSRERSTIAAAVQLIWVLVLGGGDCMKKPSSGSEVKYERRPVPHARQTVGIRTTLFATERLF